MIVIRETPVYISRELCTDANMEYTSDIFCYAALVERDIIGFCAFKIEGQTAIILHAEAPSADVLDGVIRAAIAGGEDKGAKFYDFTVNEEVAKRILPLGFRKSVEKTPHSIEKLFSVCNGGCGKKEN